MTLDLDRLETLAKAATPGEWNAPGDGDLQYENGVPVVQGAYGHDGYFVDDNDAKFVAALRPEVALALIAEVRALREDKALLDSGCIVTHERDEFGEEYTCERRGNDLRAMIDAARREKA